MAKPTGAICNLDCSYCFYLEKEALYPHRAKNWKMSEEVLVAYISQYIESQPSNTVDFLWQGGEPLMMGRQFFSRAIELSNKFANGKRITHSIQTNGILIDEKWSRFFREHNILVGISIDGPERIHNKYRVTRNGKGSYQQVLAGLKYLKQHQVDFNVLTVVGRHNVNNPIQVYEHIKHLGAKHIQFIPLVEKLHPSNKSTDEIVTSWTTPALAYGKFLTQIFHKWIRHDIGEIYVQAFDTTFSAWNGLPSGICITSKTCGHSLALEANGDLYQCDHFVEEKHKLGNILVKSISELNNSAQANSFGDNKYTDLSKDCQSCTYQFACFGGCPKHRFITDATDGSKNNYLCDGYRYFYSQITPYMNAMTDLIRSGHSPITIRDILSSNNS